MEPLAIVAIILGLAVFAIGGVLAWLLLRPQETSNEVLDAVDKLATAQTALSGRLDQMAQTSAADQGVLRKAFDERLDAIAKRVGDALGEQGRHHGKLLEGLKERLAVIDTAQKNITELSSQVVGLQDVLSNKQARGAFGEYQLADLVRDILPPSAYDFQAPIGEGRRADCLIRLPNPPGAIVVDAKFPLESYYALREADDATRTAAQRAFRDAVGKHVSDIAERYIVPGETAESALMFLPAEAVYAELYANFPEIVERSYRQRVWIVSPTTLMATLNTVRAVLKDAHMREQASVIQEEVLKLLTDLGRLDKRVDNLEKHFDQAVHDVRDIRISSNKITSRGERIVAIEMGDDEDEISEAIAPPVDADQ